MILAENDAKTKWCPYRAPNRPMTDKASNMAYTNCIGSGCFVWQWTSQGTLATSPGQCGLAK